MPQSGFTPIITYNTATASAAPSAGNLTQGELAVNVTDKKIYTKNSGGSVVQVGSGPDATETLTNKTLTSPDINGGTIDGTAIGGTTPAAGSFTTLSASGGVTNTAGRSNFSSNDAYAIGAKNTGGGPVYFGATDSTASPGGHIANSGGGEMIAWTYAGAVSIPGSLSTGTLSASGVTTLSGGTIVNNGSGIVNPGALQGSMFHHANYLQFAGGTTGTSFNNHANTVANLTIADAGAVTIPGNVGIGVTPSASIGGGRELTVYGGVSIRGDSRYWYIDGKSGQDAMVIGLRASGDTVDTDAINIDSAGAVTIPGVATISGALGMGSAPNTAMTSGVGAPIDSGIYGFVQARNFSNNLGYYGGGWKYPKGNNGTASWLLGGDSTNFSIYVAPQCTAAVDSAAGTVTNALNINGTTGSVTFNSGTFGYGTGAGGTVTQATSKSTAVTLNKPCGQITMHNAALAAGDVALFQVTNSVAVASSIVLVSPNANPAGEFYSVWSSHTFAGGFFVCVKNITAGSRSEALVINFAVLSGATS